MRRSGVGGKSYLISIVQRTWLPHKQLLMLEPRQGRQAVRVLGQVRARAPGSSMGGEELAELVCQRGSG